MAGRGTTQEEDKDSGLGQARYAFVRSGSVVLESSTRKSGKGAEQGDRLGGPTVSHGGLDQLSALAQTAEKTEKQATKSL